MESSWLLSEIVINTRYARFSHEKQRKETWNELVQRNKQMHLNKFRGVEDIEKDINEAYRLIENKKLLPSMRSLQFAGKGIDVNPTRMYNCAYLPIDNWKAFSETMFLLLSGCGVGFSVQYHHVEKLPAIRKPNSNRRRRYLISDSVEGWADSIKMLMKSFFQLDKSENKPSTIIFDYNAIREKGTPLRTSGGVAPGPQGLKEAILKITGILENMEDGQKLTPLMVNDIICIIAGAVLSGGIRRSALISLFSYNDDEMFGCKSGDNWYHDHPYRCRANNSVVVERQDITKEDYTNLWRRIFSTNTGEPGVYLTNDKDLGANPCCEISLNPKQFCNLVEINVSDIENDDDFIKRCKAASFIATLQSTYTDFHYLRNSWKKTTEREMLIGVSMTGMSSNKVSKELMKQGALTVKNENKRMSEKLNIKKAFRTTTIKPAGTTSLVVGSSSGIHTSYGKFYLRRIRLNKNDAVYERLLNTIPELIEDEVIRPHDTAVLTIAIKSPEGTIIRNEETALEFLNRIKDAYTNWIIPGHSKGVNRNNVSATVYVKENEREEIIEWLYDNREYYNGLTIFPYMETSTVYAQTPFEEIDETKFNEYNDIVKSHWSEIIDIFDIKCQSSSTDIDNGYDYEMNLEPACFGGVCELK